MALIIFLTFYVKFFNVFIVIEYMYMRILYACVYTHMHICVCIVQLGFTIYLNCSSSFNNSVTCLTKLSLIWVPRDKQYVGCCVGGCRQKIIAFSLVSPTLCSIYAKGQKCKAALNTRNLCIVGKDEAQTHRDRE